MNHEILDLTYYGGEDLYSDGEIEEEMLRIFEEKEDVQQILEKSTDWALLYHLSDMRHTLLEWYPVPEGSTCLEIGAGCGAVTGLLCKKFSKVVGVELSKRRSMINAARNKNYENLKILVGNFQDIQIEEKFDFVTLIGVLEYSASYMGSARPYEDMLQRVKQYLKPGGKLIIAIENKNGLKYWAGASEDHTGGCFDGIEDYRKHDWIRTFSKKELTDLLNSCGYRETSYYYPVPDYKMPVAVYSDGYLPKPGDLRGMDVAFDRPRYKLFEDDVVFDRICREGNFPEYSNSFLVFAGLDEMSREKAEPTVLYSKFNRARCPKFRLSTTIYEKNGDKYVEKTPLNEEAAQHIRALKDSAEEQSRNITGIDSLIPELKGGSAVYPFLETASLEQELQQEIGDPDALIGHMKQYNAMLEEAFRPRFEPFRMTDMFREVFGEIPENAQEAVSDLGIDMLYDNILDNGGKPVSLDCEWVFHDPVPFRFLIYRNIYYFYSRYHYYLETKISEEEFFSRFEFEKEETALYKEMEAHFQQYVQGEGYRYSVTKNYVKTLPQNVFERLQEAESLSSERLEICMERLKLIRHYEGLTAQQTNTIQEQHQIIENLRSELAQVRTDLQKEQQKCREQAQRQQSRKAGILEKISHRSSEKQKRK